MDCAVLIATRNRTNILSERALVALASQTRKPEYVVLVDDSDPGCRAGNSSALQRICGHLDCVYLENQKTLGAAGAWNTGLAYLVEKFKDCWVAILDDDDAWMPDHLQLCMEHSLRQPTDAVISGIETVSDGRPLPCDPPTSFSWREFLKGNPGWQGSNTFVRLQALQTVSGFDEGLQCTHDRDLAIRLLRTPGFQMTFTGKKTVAYFLDSSRPALSSRGSLRKTTGLLQFWRKYSDQMTAKEQTEFKDRAKSYFDVTPETFHFQESQEASSGFKSAPNVEERTLFFNRLYYRLRGIYRSFRTHKWVTRVLGPQYKRSHDQIEIDITYACNLSCYNCNRSCRQAPESRQMSTTQIKAFVDDSVSRHIRWKRIRLMGGEPTLHPEFDEFLKILIDYKKVVPEVRLEVVTNGFGDKVKRKLLEIPPCVHVENSQKESDLQTHFCTFNLAPVDDLHYSNVDFRNGCSVLEECGIGLSSMGYYPCSIAAGIDRVAGWNLGQPQIPLKTDDLSGEIASFCQMCGRFKDGHFVPYNLREELTEERISVSWQDLYDSWSKNQNRPQRKASS